MVYVLYLYLFSLSFHFTSYKYKSLILENAVDHKIEKPEHLNSLFLLAMDKCLTHYEYFNSTTLLVRFIRILSSVTF
jgi:hypothetical protein